VLRGELLGLRVRGRRLHERSVLQLARARRLRRFLSTSKSGAEAVPGKAYWDEERAAKDRGSVGLHRTTKRAKGSSRPGQRKIY